jgi:hypothetical protein
MRAPPSSPVLGSAFGSQTMAGQFPEDPIPIEAPKKNCCGVGNIFQPGRKEPKGQQVVGKQRESAVRRRPSVLGLTSSRRLQGLGTQAVRQPQTQPKQKDPQRSPVASPETKPAPKTPPTVIASAPLRLGEPGPSNYYRLTASNPPIVCVPGQMPPEAPPESKSELKPISPNRSKLLLLLYTIILIHLTFL